MEELHLSRKDFEIVWFSGQGPGGQHRNRHSNCCRITHKETGLTAQCTAHKERSANRREAFEVVAARILDHYQNAEPKERRRGGEVIRTYHGVRNEVIDRASGLRASYRAVVVDANLGEMIEARRQAKMREQVECAC